MVKILQKGDCFHGPNIGSRRYNWHVDRVLDSVIEPQVDGVRVKPAKWPEDDPRWDKLKFVDKPIDPYVVEATRYKITGPDHITLVGKSHMFSVHRNATAPRHCKRMQRIPASAKARLSR